MIQSQFVTRIVRKSTPVLTAAVMAIGLLAGASRGLAETMTWTNGSDLWTSATAWQTNLATGIDPVTLTNITCGSGSVSNITAYCVGGYGVPQGDDQARFTNNTTYTVTVNTTTNVAILTTSNTVGVLTINAGPSSTLVVTGRVRIADGGATSTVVWAGGTLSSANSGLGSTQIGSANPKASGVLVVTNGTVIAERDVWLGTTASDGKLVVSGSGVFTNNINQVVPGFTLSARSAGSQLVVTNGGKLFWAGEVRCSSNGLILVSGPTSLLYVTNDPPQTSTLACGSPGFSRLESIGSRLIVSNGAKVYSDGTISIGRNGASYNTGVVVGAGSKLISSSTLPDSGACFTIGVGSAGGNSNDLTVYDGGYVECGGAFFSVPGGACTNSSFHMGGVGAISTGLAVAVRMNSAAVHGLIVVTNAVLNCTKMSVGGSNGNLTVLSKGTLNVNVPSDTETNGLSVSALSSALIINAGTINAVGGGTNLTPVTVGGSGTLTGNSLIITNGGKLLSEAFTVGNSSALNTGIVTGAGSVLSNFTAGVLYDGTNTIAIGSGAGWGTNFFTVRDGASLYNNGTFSIGNSPTSVVNSVFFGGPGLAAVIVNNGLVNIGSGSNIFGNSLTVSNASLTCDTLYVGGSGGVKTNYNNSLVFKGGTIAANFMKIQSSNNVTFTAGILSVGQFASEVGANNSNEFVVGDGTSAAFFDMALGGSNYYDFGSPGFTVTNGATLRGSGTLSGTVTVLGTFVPGFAGTAGSVYCSNSLTFGTSTMEFDLGTSRDSVTVGGNLGLGTSTINVTALSGFTATTYVLFTHTNVVSGTLSVGNMPGGFSGVVSNDLPNTPRILLKVTATGGGDPYAAWVSHYGLTGGNALGTADPDHDGMSNTNEFLAGFSPTSSAASLQIKSATRSVNNDINITYLGASGDSTWSPGVAYRTNLLQSTSGSGGSYSNNFVDTAISQILSNGTGLGTTSTMIDPQGGTNKPAKYYRVRVVLP